MNTNRETNRSGIYGSDPAMPSGAEVEAATLHVPVGELGDPWATQSHSHMQTHSDLHTHEHLPERSGIRGKLDTLKEQGLSKVHDLQRVVNDRSATLKSDVSRSVALMKSNVNRSVASAKTSLRTTTSTRVDDMQTSMRNSPMKWAGIAAGTGFGLGLIGRFMHWRNKHQRVMPQLVVIERSC